MKTDDSVIARLAALKRMPAARLRAQWQMLFQTPPPPTATTADGRDARLRRPSPLNPDRLTIEERRAELGAILAAGLVRLRARQSSQVSRDQRESSVDFRADQMGHVVVPKRRMA
ncbi:MAG: hypothetical protein R3D68_06555 [Hyphomicrobiaceae bacterium]